MSVPPSDAIDIVKRRWCNDQFSRWCITHATPIHYYLTISYAFRNSPLIGHTLRTWPPFKLIRTESKSTLINSNPSQLIWRIKRPERQTGGRHINISLIERGRQSIDGGEGDLHWDFYYFPFIFLFASLFHMTGARVFTIRGSAADFHGAMRQSNRRNQKPASIESIY